MKEVAKILYGSQNYYLDGPESDLDYKILMMPSFDDFYNYRKVSKDDLPKDYDPEHYSVMSLLTFDKNLRAGNINALELLFSRYSYVYNANLEVYLNNARKAYEQGYIFSVWDSFTSTVEGMIKNSIDRYGVTRKSASRAMYLIKFYRFVAYHNFEINKSSWAEDEVVKSPKLLRFEETVPLPTQRELFQCIDFMKEFAEDCRNYYRLMNSQSELDLVASWNDDLAKCMKDVVRKSLRSEL